MNMADSGSGAALLLPARSHSIHQNWHLPNFQLDTWKHYLEPGQVQSTRIIIVRTKLSEELGNTAAADRKRVTDGRLDDLPVAST